MKSIDYLKLVKTAKTQRTGGRLSEADQKLNAVVWYGAILNAVVTAGIGVGLSMMDIGFDSEFTLVAIFGVVPALIYFVFWIFASDAIPRASRFMIGTLAFLAAAMIIYYTYKERFEYWYVLVPVVLYFSAVASVALTQVAAIGSEVRNGDQSRGGGNAA